MGDDATVMEVYDLLLYNYVEDDDAMFRCWYKSIRSNSVIYTPHPQDAPTRCATKTPAAHGSDAASNHSDAAPVVSPTAPGSDKRSMRSCQCCLPQV